MADDTPDPSSARVGEPPKDEGGDKKPKKGLAQRPLLLLGLIVGAAILLIAAVLFFLHARKFQSTEALPALNSPAYLESVGARSPPVNDRNDPMLLPCSSQLLSACPLDFGYVHGECAVVDVSCRLYAARAVEA